MAKVFLIRHGQASFGAENYDQLSDLGKEQAQALGEYFYALKQPFDHIIHGNMWRQTETAQIMANHMGHEAPMQIESDADEFDSDELLAHYLPILASQSPIFAELIEADSAWYSDHDNFELVFRGLIRLWQADGNCPFESWLSFKDRVVRLLNQLAESEHKKIALVTSGGFISVTLQSILGFDNQVFMDMSLTINNASVTEILFTQNRKSSIKTTEPSMTNKLPEARLLCFNNISPLKEKKKPQLITRK